MVDNVEYVNINEIDSYQEEDVKDHIKEMLDMYEMYIKPKSSPIRDVNVYAERGNVDIDVLPLVEEIPVSQPLGKFSITAKGWFLTYPKCDLDKEQAMQLLMAKRPDVERCIVSSEKHKDGSKHLHAYVQLANRFSCKNARFWDIQGFHGNYAAAKSFYAVSKYIIKDGDYCQWGMDAKAEVESRKGHKKILGEKLIKGAELVEVVEENPQLLFEYERLSKGLAAFKRDRACLNAKKVPLHKEILKKRHNWIWGPSNSGKTTMLRKILSHKGYGTDDDRTFQIPTNNDWVGYLNQKYLWIDEFKGQLTIQELNRICDGRSKVNIKGGTAILRDDVEVLIISNFSISECYSKAEEVVKTALYNRFHERYSPEIEMTEDFYIEDENKDE